MKTNTYSNGILTGIENFIPEKNRIQNIQNGIW